MRVGLAIEEIENLVKGLIEVIATLHTSTEILVKIKEENGDVDVDLSLDQIQAHIRELMGIVK